MLEVVDMFDEGKRENGKTRIKMIGLVETHEKYRKVELPERFQAVYKMRDMQDKKGGGLMFVTRLDDKIEVGKWESDCRDLLPVEVEIMGRKILVMLVYMDVGDLDRNS